jgi:hypothetical protein
MTSKTIITTIYEEHLRKLQEMGHNVGATKPYGKANYACLYQAFILMCKVFKKVVNVMCILLLSIELYNLFF